MKKLSANIVVLSLACIFIGIANADSKVMPWIPLLLLDNNYPSETITKFPRIDGVFILGYAQAGSIFSLTIRNDSNRTFNLNKFEFKYYGSIVASTTDNYFLSDGQLTENESVGISVTIRNDYLGDALTSTFFLSDPTTGENFTVSYDWLTYFL